MGQYLLTQSGIMAATNPNRYAGYRYDEQTKLYYLMARYYNPYTGVFLSLDPVRGDVKNPLTMNRYNYANNNPVMNVDPDGEFSFSATVKKALRTFIKYLFKDFRENTLTNIFLILSGGSIGAWVARKATLKGFTMLNRQPVKKAVQGFISGGLTAYI
jgi:RHS repeat-associated protein